MKMSERTLRISAASFIALFMIGGSYLISGPNFFTQHFANAASTDDLLKAYAAKDSDGDGLPDWEEALYGTDPNKAISNQFGISDGEAAREGKLTSNSLASQLPQDTSSATSTAVDVDRDIPGVNPIPGSITEQFSQQFLQQVIQSSNGQPLDDATQQQLITSMLSSIGQKVSSSFVSNYGYVDVHTSTSISTPQYIQSVETILQEDDISNSDNPYDLMLQLIQGTDPASQHQASIKLQQLSQAFSIMESDARDLKVPPSQANSHILLVQSLHSLSKATAVVADYQKDPIATLGAISTYSTGSDSFSKALNQFAASVLANGEPTPGEPGYLIVQLARISNS